MPPIDESRPFVPCRIAVLTVSDTRTEQNDTSGSTLVELATGAGHQVGTKQIVRDELPALLDALRRFIADPEIDVVIATGGTGVTGRDVTPEAFFQLYDKELPGFGELFRRLSFEHIGTAAIQSRATAGVASGTYLFALPGSTSACRDAWRWVLAPQLDSRQRPCNLVELMPRLGEGSAADQGDP